MSKLGFRVASVSSEEEGFPAQELNVHGPQTKGWQVRTCTLLLMRFDSIFRASCVLLQYVERFLFIILCALYVYM